MLNLFNKINSSVWGTPTLLLIFFTGVVLSLRTGFFQIRCFKTAFKTFFKKPQTKNGKKMTPFQSASTALSATMGTGNIVGVAGAIALGGPGAVFWMWVSALVCMIIKFSEIALSVRYREKDPHGHYLGGAMYYIKNALPKFFLPLAYVFCACGVAAAFGVGNLTQINTISNSVSSLVNSISPLLPHQNLIVKLLAGLCCAIVCFFVLKNDCSIGRFCEKIFPVMTILYVGMTTLAIAVNFDKLPSVFSQIFIGAINPKCVTGGAIGSVFIAVRFGMSRGVFSNESGLGTAPIAYACSEGDEISLGLMGIIEVFIDTIVVCTLTALTILCAGDISYSVDGASLITLSALTSSLGQNVIFLFCPVVCFFAFSSVIGWGLYGARFFTFLFGDKSKNVFLTLFILAQLPAAIFRADAVWVIAEIFNGLMCIPNITALLFLTNEVADIVGAYKRKHRGV